MHLNAGVALDVDIPRLLSRNPISLSPWRGGEMEDLTGERLGEGVS